MVMLSFLTIARLSGKLVVLKDAMKVTCNAHGGAVKGNAPARNKNVVLYLVFIQVGVQQFIIRAIDNRRPVGSSEYVACTPRTAILEAMRKG
jgi:hypothetical protein